MNMLDPENAKRNFEGKKPISKTTWAWTTIITLIIAFTLLNFIKKELENTRVERDIFSVEEKSELVKDMVYVLNTRYGSDHFTVEKYFLFDFVKLTEKMGFFELILNQNELNEKKNLFVSFGQKILLQNELNINEKKFLSDLENLNKDKLNKLEKKKIHFYFEWIKNKVIKDFKVSSTYTNDLKYYENIIKKEKKENSPFVQKLETKKFFEKLSYVVGLISGSLNKEEHNLYMNNFNLFVLALKNKNLQDIHINNVIDGINKLILIRKAHIQEVRICMALIKAINNFEFTKYKTRN